MRVQPPKLYMTKTPESDFGAKKGGGNNVEFRRPESICETKKFEFNRLNSNLQRFSLCKLLNSNFREKLGVETVEHKF